MANRFKAKDQDKSLVTPVQEQTIQNRLNAVYEIKDARHNAQIAQ